jgi:hypothetical protein
LKKPIRPGKKRAGRAVVLNLDHPWMPPWRFLFNWSGMRLFVFTAKTENLGQGIFYFAR